MFVSCTPCGVELTQALSSNARRRCCDPPLCDCAAQAGGRGGFGRKGRGFAVSGGVAKASGGGGRGRQPGGGQRGAGGRGRQRVSDPTAYRRVRRRRLQQQRYQVRGLAQTSCCPVRGRALAMEPSAKAGCHACDSHPITQQLCRWVQERRALRPAGRPARQSTACIHGRLTVLLLCAPADRLVPHPAVPAVPHGRGDWRCDSDLP